MGTNFNNLTPDAQALYNRGNDALGFLPNISSGHRTVAENAAAGGAAHSDHLTGNAFDIPTRNLTASQQQQVLDYYRGQPDVYVNDERNRPGHGPHIHVSYRGKEGGSADKGNKDDGSGSKKDDGKKGDQDGNADKDKDADARAKSKSPVEQKEHKDIKGEPGNYQKTTTKSISSILPTHEPWAGHPRSTEGPRQASDGSSGGGNGGSGSGSGSSGGGSSSGQNGAPQAKGATQALTDAQGKPLTGGDAEKIQMAYDRLVNTHGFTPDAAKAAIATTMGENLLGRNQGMHNDVNGPSAGIAQWHDVGWNGGGRYSKYVAYMNNAPGGASNFNNQIDYLAKDLKENYKGVYNTMQNSDAATGVMAMTQKFEVPRDAYNQGLKRQKNLGRINSTLKNRKPKTADPGSGDGSDQNQKPSNADKSQSGVGDSSQNGGSTGTGISSGGGTNRTTIANGPPSIRP